MDDYAQDLRRLFNRAYPSAQQGTSEVESMGRSVLAYQFVAGLRSDIKIKVAGTEGNFEQLLMKARFEEVKIRDLIDPKPKSVSNVSSTASIHQTKAGQTPPRDRGQRGDRGPRSGSLSKFGDRSICFTCGASGHFAKQCPQRGKQKSSETPG